MKPPTPVVEIAAGRRETGRRGGGIDITPKRAAFNRRDAHLCVDADRAHPTEVQKQGAIAHRKPRDVVPPPRTVTPTP